MPQPPFAAEAFRFAALMVLMCFIRKPSPKKSLTTLYHKSAGFSSVLCKNGKKFTSSVEIRRTVTFCADGYCYFGGFLWGAFTPEMPPQILPPQISSSRTGLPAVPCQNSPTAVNRKHQKRGLPHQPPVMGKDGLCGSKDYFQTPAGNPTQEKMK